MICTRWKILHHPPRNPLVVRDKPFQRGSVHLLGALIVSLLLLNPPIQNMVKVGRSEINHQIHLTEFLVRRTAKGVINPMSPVATRILFTLQKVERGSQPSQRLSASPNAPAFDDYKRYRIDSTDIRQPIILPLVEQRDIGGLALCQSIDSLCKPVCIMSAWNASRD